MPENTYEQLEGFKCIELRPLSSNHPKAGLKPGYTTDPNTWHEYPNVPKRYGILTVPNNLLVIDIDHPDEIDSSELKNTFTVQSGGGGFHLYYNKGDIINSDHSPEWGELKGTGHVVGPGVMHESGNEYKVIKNIPIETIFKSDIDSIIKDGPSKQERNLEKPNNQGKHINKSKASDNSDMASTSDDVSDPLHFIKSEQKRKEVSSILNSHAPGHNKRCWLVGWLYSVANLSEREILDLIQNMNRWSDFNLETTKKQVRSVIKSNRNGRR